MLGYTVGAEAIGQPEGEANADRRRDELRAALKSEHESAIATARARLGQLEERRDSLRSQLTQERARTQALRDAKGLPVGLAPWDALAVRAQRDLDRSAGSPDTLPIDERAEMLKGCEAADLVQQRLGISRSTYYERYRALLRPYALMPRTYEYRGGGRSLFHARATVRFRRDEIEAMLGFLTAQAC
jgi:hypothetical protein